jgi:hypothetical protein
MKRDTVGDTCSMSAATSCPKCGIQWPADKPLPITECPTCGVIFAKYFAAQAQKESLRQEQGAKEALSASEGAASRPFTESPVRRSTLGLLDGLLGNASKVDATKIQAEIGRILTPGEKVEHAYQLIRDYFVFTDRRFLLVDKQGLTGSKVEYHSIPYRSITHFSIETAGTLDNDAELKIWISGSPTPIQKQFNKRMNIYEVQSVLASYILK